MFLEDLEDLIQCAVYKEDNNIMCHMPSKQEIWEVIRCMNSLKAPGPDAMLGLFFIARA